MSLLGLLDRDDPLLALDRERATAVLAARGAVERAQARHRRGHARIAAQDLAHTDRCRARRTGIRLGALRRSRARRDVAGPRTTAPVASSASANRGPRCSGRAASLHGRGLAHCVVQHGDAAQAAGGLGEFRRRRARSRAGGDRHGAAAVAAEAARVLRPGGQLLLVEDYEALTERDARRQPARPAARRGSRRAGCSARGSVRWTSGTEHLLLATATPERAVAAA